MRRDDLGKYFECDEIFDDMDNFWNSNENEPNDGLEHNLEEPQLVDIEITLSRIEEALNLLSNNASPGPDGIPTTCLKYGGMGLKLFLMDFLRQSMDETDIPLNLRRGLISPILRVDLQIYVRTIDLYI